MNSQRRNDEQIRHDEGGRQRESACQELTERCQGEVKGHLVGGGGFTVCLLALQQNVNRVACDRVSG